MRAVDHAWKALEHDGQRLSKTHLRDLFENDPGRFESFSHEACGLLIDFSKEKLDADAMASLLALADASGLAQNIKALFAGESVNVTEQRPALHMALRDGVPSGTTVDGVEIEAEVRLERDRMLDFAKAIRSGQIGASQGRPFTDVVNIGIGGSDLGAAMATQALRPWHDGPRLHCVANVDRAALDDALDGLDPAHTLVVIASKSFSTLETMINARAARAWLQAKLGEQVSEHMAAVSTNLDAVSSFGISPDRTFGFWDWVGGRYSIWSSVGLPLAISIGPDAFRAFLSGAKDMDVHFREAPLAENLPVLLGLIGVWRRNAMGCRAHALVPYEERLGRLPAYLQQLEMESNGKRVASDGSELTRHSSGVIFGEPGTNAQHSFFQMLHQGTETIPVDFLIGSRSTDPDSAHHPALFASALAQASALAFGRTAEEVRAEMTEAGLARDRIDALVPHRTFPGDRPSTVFMYEALTPEMLGALLALFEHRTYVQGAIWGINSFDQWGVELGKELAVTVQARLDTGVLSEFDISTAALIERYRRSRR